MSTRSVIATTTDKGTLKGVYCHFDGGIGHNGRILVNHYTSEEKVNELISNGGISSLDESIGQKHSFNNRPEGQTTFYHRDRGEPLEIYNWKTTKQLKEDMYDCEFFYVFLKGDWYVADNESKFRKVNSILNKEVY